MDIQFFFWFELLSFLISIAVFLNIRKTYFVIFVPYLFLIVVYELGTRLGYFAINKSNHIVANIFLPIEFLFYSIFFIKTFSSIKIRRNIAWSFLLIIAFYGTNLIFFQKIVFYNSYTYLFGSLIMIGWSCFAFFRLVTRPFETNILSYPVFWVCAGILFFFLLRFMFMSYFNYIAYTGDLKYINLFLSISNISIVLLYTFIAIGLLCCRPPIRKL
jgi:hypothetical protein